MKKNFTVSGNTAFRISGQRTHSGLIKIIASFLLMFVFLGVTQAQTTCCPEFRLKDAVEICHPRMHAPIMPEHLILV
jgi:hypothetical protein